MSSKLLSLDWERHMSTSQKPRWTGWMCNDVMWWFYGGKRQIMPIWFFKSHIFTGRFTLFNTFMKGNGYSFNKITSNTVLDYLVSPVYL